MHWLYFNEENEYNELITRNGRYERDERIQRCSASNSSRLHQGNVPSREITHWKHRHRESLFWQYHFLSFVDACIPVGVTDSKIERSEKSARWTPKSTKVPFWRNERNEQNTLIENNELTCYCELPCLSAELWPISASNECNERNEDVEANKWV